MDLLSPYAPLYPWLGFVTRDRGVSLTLCGRGYQEEAAGLIPSTMWTAVLNTPTGEPIPPVEIDMRDLDVRVLVLEWIATYGHAYPWALGAIWSPLTDEQAGRLTAEIVRRVGPDPKVPAQVMPNGVLGPVIRHEGAGLYPGVYQESRRELVGSPYCPSSEGGKRQRGYPGPRGWSCGPHQGRQTDDLGRAMAERRAMDLGAILVEQITPKKDQTVEATASVERAPPPTTKAAPRRQLCHDCGREATLIEGLDLCDDCFDTIPDLG